MTWMDRDQGVLLDNLEDVCSCGRRLYVAMARGPLADTRIVRCFGCGEDARTGGNRCICPGLPKAEAA